MKLTKTQRLVLQNAGPGPVGFGALSILLQVAGYQDRQAKKDGRRKVKAS